MNADDVSILVSMQRDAILNICCNNGCSMSSFNTEWLNILSFVVRVMQGQLYRGSVFDEQ